MYSELGPHYKEVILPLSNPKLIDLSDQGIGFSGYSDIMENYVILRSQGYYQHLMLFTLSGEGWMRSNGVDRSLKEGDLWVSPAKNPHEYGLFGKNWKILWLSLDVINRWDVIDDIGTMVRYSSWGNKIHQLFLDIISASNHDFFNSKEEMKLLSELLLIYIDRELSLNLVSPRERELKNEFSKLFLKVEQEIHKSWDINMLQNAMEKNFSKDHFIRICRHVTGITPSKKVLALKMQRAWELICNTDLNIQEISDRIGYANSFAFSTSFKRYWGNTPSYVRAENRSS